MRILHVADLHARGLWMDWISAHARQFDLLCIAGDLLDLFATETTEDRAAPGATNTARTVSRQSLHKQAREISAWLRTLPTPTAVCTGNHDWWRPAERVTDVYASGNWLQMLANTGNIIAVDGGSARVGELSVATVGWNQPANWPEGTELVVCHSPPPSTPVAGHQEGMGGDIDQDDLWQLLWAKPPRLYLCGHIHTPRRNFYWFPPGENMTLLLNPGCVPNAAEPSRWEIDTKTQLAVWHGSGTSEVALVPPRELS